MDKRLLLCAAFMGAVLPLIAQAQDNVVLDETVKPVYFEALTYPVRARLSHIQGTVVVRATLKSDGSVASARALSGPKLLIDDAVANAGKWRFQPNQDKLVIILYTF
jgi:TonB family protein